MLVEHEKNSKTTRLRFVVYEFFECSSTDFLFGDYSDSIFEALEEDEELKDYLEAVVEEVSIEICAYFAELL